MGKLYEEKVKRETTNNDSNERLMSAYDSVVSESLKMNEAKMPKDEIEAKLKQLEKMNVFREDQNHLALGPWVDSVRKILKKM